MLDRTQAPEIRPFGRLSIPEEQTQTLSNGLTLHTLFGGDQDVARLDIIADGGTSDCENPCVASFAAELMREGNRNSDSETIADRIDYNGAWLNSSASSHNTVLQLSSLSSKLLPLAPTMIDCLVCPTFPAEAFEIIRGKGVARQKLNMSRVSFLSAADNRRMTAGDDHPESQVPTPDDIASINIDRIKAFHDRILDARHIHAYLCGRVSDSDVRRLSDMLAQIPSHQSPSPVLIKPYAPTAPGLSLIDRPGSLQCAVTMSIPAIPRSHPDYNTLRMTVTALGGYFGSRLMMNIREDKGYTYSISSALLGAREGGYITISAQCDNRYTKELIDETRAELRHMADRPLTADELTRHKFNVASDLASTLDTPMTMMDYYELRHTVGIPDDYFYARQQALSALTPEKVCETARRYLDPDALRISVAGDLEKSGLR